jgi:ATP-dependent Clp protease ATP-binding subunit ClpX
MTKCLCCGKSKENVPKMIQINSESFICSPCTSEINGMFAGGTQEDKGVKEFVQPKLLPKDIKALLDESVIGQENAKRVLCVEVYNHYKRINNLELDIQKSNVLMVGNSGTGKTLLLQTLTKILDIPMVIVNTANFTASGFKGADLEEIIQSLVSASDGDIKKAETGIIFLDELDKIAKRNTSSLDLDVSGLSVQQELLKIVEGTLVKCKVEGSRRSQNSEQYVDTKNILFCGGGSFFGLDKILEQDHNKETSGIGFSASVEKSDYTEKEITDENIIHYGFIPEFVGRFPVIVKLDKLTKEDYRRILTEPKNSIIDQYQNLMDIDNIKLNFTDDYLDGIVEKVFKSDRGARALRSEIEKTMRDIIFNINEDVYNTEITIN